MRPHSLRSWLIFAILSIMALAGAAFALTTIFPSSPGFETTPTTPGTLGHALTTYFGADGTALNTAKLGGKDASEFVTSTGSYTCPAGKAWKKISSTGQVICGSRGTILTLGTGCRDSLMDGQVIPGGSGPAQPIIPGITTIKEGDNVQAGGSQLTLCFNENKSLVRMEPYSTITIGRGTNSDDVDVLQIDVGTGQIWGRVLTSTGVNMGGGGLVAGVRGTGFGVRPGNAIGRWIFSSTQSRARNIPIANTVKGTTTLGLNVPGEVIYNIDNSGFGPGQGITGLKELYQSNPWIAQNVVQDILYLNSLPSDPLVVAENATILDSHANIDVKRTLCGQLYYDGASKWYGQQAYWSAFETSPTQSVCQAANTLAIADYTDITGNGSMRYRDEVGSAAPDIGVTLPATSGSSWARPTPTPTPNIGTLGGPLSSLGASMTGTGYISYDLATLSGAIGGLSGKTVEIELGDIAAMKAGTSGLSTIYRIGSPITTLYYAKSLGKYRCIKPASGTTTYDCISGQDYVEEGNTIKILMPTYLPSLTGNIVFGNTELGGNAINTQIKLIKIY